MTTRVPAAAGLNRIRLPGNLTELLHRVLNVTQSVQGNPVPRQAAKPKSLGKVDELKGPDALAVEPDDVPLRSS